MYLAANRRKQGVVDIETFWRQDNCPEAEDSIWGPAAQLDQEEEPADLGHGGLVLGEGHWPPFSRLRHLDLLDTSQEHDQPDIMISQCTLYRYLHCRDGNDVGEDDEEQNEVIVVSEVSVPVVDGAGRTSGLQTESPCTREFIII